MTNVPSGVFLLNTKNRNFIEGQTTAPANEDPLPMVILRWLGVAVTVAFVAYWVFRDRRLYRLLAVETDLVVWQVPARLTSSFRRSDELRKEGFRRRAAVVAYEIPVPFARGSHSGRQVERESRRAFGHVQREHQSRWLMSAITLTACFEKN
jgi:hypothetical protein